MYVDFWLQLTLVIFAAGLTQVIGDELDGRSLGRFNGRDKDRDGARDISNAMSLGISPRSSFRDGAIISEEGDPFGNYRKEVHINNGGFAHDERISQGTINNANALGSIDGLVRDQDYMNKYDFDNGKSYQKGFSKKEIFKGNDYVENSQFENNYDDEHTMGGYDEHSDNNNVSMHQSKSKKRVSNKFKKQSENGYVESKSSYTNSNSRRSSSQIVTNDDYDNVNYPSFGMFAMGGKPSSPGLIMARNKPALGSYQAMNVPGMSTPGFRSRVSPSMSQMGFMPRSRVMATPSMGYNPGIGPMGGSSMSQMGIIPSNIMDNIRRLQNSVIPNTIPMEGSSMLQLNFRPVPIPMGIDSRVPQMSFNPRMAQSNFGVMSPNRIRSTGTIRPIGHNMISYMSDPDDPNMVQYIGPAPPNFGSVKRPPSGFTSYSPAFRSYLHNSESEASQLTGDQLSTDDYQDYHFPA